MAERMKTIAYLIYGDRREYQLELTLSVASIIRHLRRAPSDIRIVLVCDRQDIRLDLPVEYSVFSRADFDFWTDGGKYQHAAKLGALKKIIDDTEGPVAFVDTDTIFLRHPDEMFAHIKSARSVMQKRDAPIGELDYWHELLRKAPSTVAGYPIRASSPMNNSGVIGIDQADVSWIEEAKSLVFALHRIEPVFNIEQFAVTCALAKHTVLSVIPDIVYHYWPTHERLFQHAYVEDTVPSFTAQNFERLVKKTDQIGLPQKRFLDRVVATIKGKLHRWDGDYKFAFLAYRSALSTDDPMHSQVWMNIARNHLARNSYPASRIARDFPAIEQ